MQTSATRTSREESLTGAPAHGHLLAVARPPPALPTQASDAQACTQGCTPPSQTSLASVHEQIQTQGIPAWGKELLACFAGGERMARAVTPLPLARSTQPWTFGPPGAAWYDALKYIAAHRDETTMPPNMLVDHDPYTYTICDGYAKAQYHFLILPRIPFYIDVQDQGISTRVQVPTRDLDSIQALLQSRHASAVLDRLSEARHRVRTNNQKAHR